MADKDWSNGLLKLAKDYSSINSSPPSQGLIAFRFKPPLKRATQKGHHGAQAASTPTSIDFFTSLMPS